MDRCSGGSIFLSDRHQAASLIQGSNPQGLEQLLLGSGPGDRMGRHGTTGGHRGNADAWKRAGTTAKQSLNRRRHPWEQALGG